VVSIEVSVGEDKIHGTVAHVVAKPSSAADAADVRQRIDLILGHFAVRYEVEFAGGA
jgi:hypothetical protein